MAQLRTFAGIALVCVVLCCYFGMNALHTEDATGYGAPVHQVSNNIIALGWSYILYLVLSTGIIGFLLFVGQVERFKLFFLIITSFILFICYAMQTQGVHGRYIDPFLPLIIIAALSSNYNRKYVLLGFAASMMAVVFFPWAYYDTINSAINAWLLLPNVQYIAVVGVMCSLAYLIFSKKETYKVVAVVLLILFSAGIVVDYRYVYTASTNAWEYCTIGRYIDDNGIVDVSFDEDDLESWWATYCLINYYRQDFIPVERETTHRWFISSEELPYKRVVEEKQYKALDNKKRGGVLYLYYISPINLSISE